MYIFVVYFQIQFFFAPNYLLALLLLVFLGYRMIIILLSKLVFVFMLE